MIMTLIANQEIPSPQWLATCTQHHVVCSAKQTWLPVHSFVPLLPPDPLLRQQIERTLDAQFPHLFLSTHFLAYLIYSHQLSISNYLYGIIVLLCGR